MKLQFDPNQPYQLDAVAAVTDLFDGQPQGAPEYAVIRAENLGELFAGQTRTELGVGNHLLLPEEKLHANTRAVQARNDIEVTYLEAPLAVWELFDMAAHAARPCPHFSVEMETGTGKTYVYLRTIFELSRRYGFQKFIIVVPSVAIREGVLKNIEITGEHFRALYNNLPFASFVYDAKKVNRLRQFAVNNTLQILVINIDAFRKNFTGTEEEQKGNVIYRESDKLSGRQPIEFVQAARPIVIIDEPQSVDATAKAQEAIKALNPLCTLRYSATHRNLYNLVYRLDPVRAFELKLVKQIVVASATADGGLHDAFVQVEKIDYTRGIKAKLRIHMQTPQGPKEESVTVKNGTDLYTLSNERACYQNGFVVAEISAEPGNEYLRFNNGRVLRLGQEIGSLRDDVWRAQIKHTVKKHLDKELQVRARGIKVLSLFFIDRVANYRAYNADGQPVQGKFARAFEAALAELAHEERYRELDWLKLPIERLHNGYFAQDKKGVPKDTRGDTQADAEVYNLIMQDKERLLSLGEPLRFIFSHSALREGWDNPNVFQICTLNETRSMVRKRQEIGRGLRLPVDQSGQRVFDASVNRLCVVANESYEDFARALQAEYEEDCGVTFGQVPIRQDRDEDPNRLRKDVQLSPAFQALWERIKPQTTYRVEFETDELVVRAVAALRRMDKVEPAQLHVSAGQLGVTRGGITATAVSIAAEEVSFGMRPMPDMLAYLQHETELTRSTLVRILTASGRLAEFFVDPQRFMDAVAAILKHELHRLLVDGIKYERLPSTASQAAWEMMLCKHEELINYLTALQVQKSLYEYVAYDAEVEREFAGRLDQRQDIKLCVKLPGWFEIDTPVGKYNPDWAILKEGDQTLYLVRETKATRDFLKLRTSEADKVRCGQRHCKALGVPFAVTVSADEV
jgi:type III restriction enzyme